MSVEGRLIIVAEGHFEKPYDREAEVIDQVRVIFRSIQVPPSFWMRFWRT
jgi:hypothetical protein